MEIMDLLMIACVVVITIGFSLKVVVWQLEFSIETRNTARFRIMIGLLIVIALIALAVIIWGVITFMSIYS